MIELTVENLHLGYGDTAVLKGVSMELHRGEVVSLLGPSGSGKTTLLRAVAGLETPAQGRIRIGERLVFDSATRTEVPAERRDLGLVFQSYALWPHKTVFHNVAYPLQLRKTPAAEVAQRVHQVLGQLGLAGLAERHPHQLSGGQQQRVAIGRALAYNPQVLLLDEPLSNLDAKLREEARAFLRELIVRLGLSALMVTHDQREAMAISDRILLLNEGRIEQQGTPEEMYAAPATLFCAEFMGNNNLLLGTAAEVHGGLVRIEGPGWSIRARAGAGLGAGQPACAVVRVEQVQVRQGEWAGGPGDNRLRMALVTSMYLGDRWEYVFRMPGAGTGGQPLGLRAYGAARCPPGDYWLELPVDRVWAFPAGPHGIAGAAPQDATPGRAP
ncbi:MAG: ABC transporter ATP-binding protein [Pseudomonadota bacterium]